MPLTAVANCCSPCARAGMFWLALPTFTLPKADIAEASAETPDVSIPVTCCTLLDTARMAFAADLTPLASTDDTVVNPLAMLLNVAPVTPDALNADNALERFATPCASASRLPVF